MKKNSNFIVKNKRNYFDYEIIEKFETGICLKGHEVKSVRKKEINIRASYVKIIKNEAYLSGVSISSFQKQNQNKEKENREIKLLLHKKQIFKIMSKTKEKRLTTIVLKVYLKQALIKVQIALAKGKKKYEKKQVLKERSIKREIKKGLY